MNVAFLRGWIDWFKAPRRLRIVGWSIVAVMVAVTVVSAATIASDHGYSPAEPQTVLLSYSCPRQNQLVVLRTPQIEISITSHGYNADFSALVASAGGGRLCELQLRLPSGYQAISGTMTSSGDVATGAAPQYGNSDSRIESLTYSFSSGGATWRNAWGEETLDLQAGIISSDESQDFDLAVECPDAGASQIDTAFPNNALESRLPYENSNGTVKGYSDEAIWQMSPSSDGAIFTLTCQNAGIRYAVDHAPDALGLALGVILGLLIGLRSVEDSPDAVPPPRHND
jgi:hypothetical protein